MNDTKTILSASTKIYPPVWHKAFEDLLTKLKNDAFWQLAGDHVSWFKKWKEIIDLWHTWLNDILIHLWEVFSSQKARVQVRSRVIGVKVKVEFVRKFLSGVWRVTRVHTSSSEWRSVKLM